LDIHKSLFDSVKNPRENSNIGGTFSSPNFASGEINDNRKYNGLDIYNSDILSSREDTIQELQTKELEESTMNPEDIRNRLSLRQRMGIASVKILQDLAIQKARLSIRDLETRYKLQIQEILRQIEGVMSIEEEKNHPALASIICSYIIGAFDTEKEVEMCLEMTRQTVEEYVKNFDILGIRIAKITNKKISKEQLSDKEKRIFQEGLSTGYSLVSDNKYEVKILEAKKELLDDFKYTVETRRERGQILAWIKTRAKTLGEEVRKALEKDDKGEGFAYYIPIPPKIPVFVPVRERITREWKIIVERIRDEQNLRVEFLYPPEDNITRWRILFK